MSGVAGRRAWGGRPGACGGQAGAELRGCYSPTPTPTGTPAVKDGEKGDRSGRLKMRVFWSKLFHKHIERVRSGIFLENMLLISGIVMVYLRNVIIVMA